jgi:hypothetical protein
MEKAFSTRVTGFQRLPDNNLQYPPAELRRARAKTLHAHFRRLTVALNRDDDIFILQIR